MPAIGTLLLAIIATPEKLTDVSRKAVSWRLQRRTTLTLDDLAKEVNPVLRGWLTYFTAFYSTAVIPGRPADRNRCSRACSPEQGVRGVRLPAPAGASAATPRYILGRRRLGCLSSA